MKYVIVIILFSSCSFNQVCDSFYQTRFKKMNLYYDDYSNIYSYSDIASWINNRITYQQDKFDYWSAPSDVIARGYGDCDDYALLFINIAYIVFGDECNLILVDKASLRTVVKGGVVNHAMVEKDGEFINQYSGGIITYVKVGFTYTFDELFWRTK